MAARAVAADQPPRRWRSTWVLLGPAFVAAVAYVDPGNFATNFAGGGRYGYRLLWVIVAANLMAMLIQSLTAKLGLATGKDLASLCRAHLPRPVTWGLWVQAEAVAIATDLAEVVGGAVALHLLFGVPLPIGGLITAVVAFGLLTAQTRGYRPFEAVITGLLAVIALGFAYTLLVSGLEPGALARGLVPGFADTESVLLATGILGATVMPHVIYVHSALTPGRYRSTIGSPSATGAPVSTKALRRVLRAQRLDVLLAMGGAGLINATMLIVAAQMFAGDSVAGTLEGAHASLATAAGSGAALAFALALLASGFAASSVGTFAGQVVMAGFLQRQIPLWLRRTLTLAPALLVLGAGADPTIALVWSQVVLSFGIPFALIPLVIFTARRSLMGDLVNRTATTVTASAVATLIVALNAFLLWDLAT
ncbi:Nramp family divalent metal transporter [Actinotalea ferrariae]|nr:Nramp family divalent metal transporter [Actinotalea ferrariae]